MSTLGILQLKENVVALASMASQSLVYPCLYILDIGPFDIRETMRSNFNYCRELILTKK
jgi:hypothetical protein